MYRAEKPLRFATANGQSLSGGDKCATVKIRLQNYEVQPGWMEYEIEFYEAIINVDATLSYPWLAEQELGISPNHKALVQDSPDLKFLFGTRDVWKSKEMTPEDAYSIREISVQNQRANRLKNLGLHFATRTKRQDGFFE